MLSSGKQTTSGSNCSTSLLLTIQCQTCFIYFRILSKFCVTSTC